MMRPWCRRSRARASPNPQRRRHAAGGRAAQANRLPELSAGMRGRSAAAPRRRLRNRGALERGSAGARQRFGARACPTGPAGTAISKCAMQAKATKASSKLCRLQRALTQRIVRLSEELSNAITASCLAA